MLFVHAADIHLDSPLRNLALAESQQIERVRRATRDAFQALIDLCIARQACLLILERFSERLIRKFLERRGAV